MVRPLPIGCHPRRLVAQDQTGPGARLLVQGPTYVKYYGVHAIPFADRSAPPLSTPETPVSGAPSWPLPVLEPGSNVVSCWEKIVA